MNLPLRKHVAVYAITDWQSCVGVVRTLKNSHAGSHGCCYSSAQMEHHGQGYQCS